MTDQPSYVLPKGQKGKRNSRDEPVLPCPECRERGHAGIARIGNRAGHCPTCNRFNQAVRHDSLVRLRNAHPDEYRQIRPLAEIDVYKRIIIEYREQSEDQ